MPRQKKELTDVPEGEAKPSETKAEKFTRLATARTTNALQRIAQLETLGGAGYESTPEQRAAIVSALSKAVSKVDTAFSATKESGKPTFTF